MLGRNKILDVRELSVRSPVPLQVLCCLVLFASSLATAGTPSPTMQARVRAATFEIVMKKPETDSLTYERPLPLELLPYKERNDPYISIGSAFAIGENRFVTAAHVLSLGFRTQYGPPALRGADGVVHAIDQIHKYSSAQDFAVFSCADCNAVAALETYRTPELDSQVFAVGNALGEGVVIRDGLLTSMTPEFRDGKWKWLRFSAAASPGNSGGPLLDAQGRVIGIVLLKSESENLNYALPIAELLDAPEAGHLDTEMWYALPVVDLRESDRRKLDFPLPKSLAEVGAISTEFFEQLHDDLSTELKRKHAATLFPNGSGAAQLFYVNVPTESLAIIARGADGTWDAYTGQNPQTAQLEDNGYVIKSDFGRYLLIKIRRPDSTDAGRFYADSKAYLDTLLKVWTWQRHVGREKVRITSMGEAATDSIFVDEYGRKWQLRTWNCEYQDVVVMSLALPTPDGYVGIVAWAKTAGQFDPLSDMRAMTRYSHVSYSGSLEQWQAYLAMRDLRPESFENLDLAFEYGNRLEVRAPRFAFSYTHAQQKIAPDSRLMLMLGFVRDGEHVRWEPTGLTAVDDVAERNAIAIARRAAPEAGLPQSFMIDWQNLLARQHPFDGRMEELQGVTSIGTIHPFPAGKRQAAEPKVVYTLVRARQGQFKSKAMQAELKQWSRGLQVLESPVH